MRTVLLSLFLSVMTVVGANAQSLTSVVAVVNGELITSRELDKILAPELANSRLDPNNPAQAQQINELRRQVLDNMITERILRQEATRLGVSVSDKMVDEELDMFLAQHQVPRAQLETELAKQGVSISMLRDRIESNIINQMLLGRMVYNKVVVTEEEINAYFQENTGQTLMQPVEPAPQPVVVQEAAPEAPKPPFKYRRVRIALLVYPPEESAESWAKKIAAGETSFAQVARKISVGPNAAEGGDMGSMPMGDLAEGLQFIASMLLPGEVSPLLDMGDLKAQVRLVDASPKPSVPAARTPEPAPVPEPQFKPVVIGSELNKETATLIEDMIRRPRLEARFEEYTRNLRNKAIIEVRI